MDDVEVSLLEPSPNVTENHQEENARGLEDVGAAEVLVEAGWQLDRSVEIVVELMNDGPRLTKMNEAAAAQARMDAAEQAADVIEALLRG